MKSLRSSSFRLAVIALLCCASAAAHAQPSAADKETARSLLLDGRAKMEARDFTGALKAFEAAHAIMGVPTTGLDLSRAQEALGRLLEARETALNVTRIAVTPGESPAFAEARKAASDLAAQLAPRIPALVLSVRAPDTAAVTVKIDGAAIPAASLGLPRKVNPGRHAIEASAPGLLPATREVNLVEGQTQPVELSLAPVTGVVPPASASAAPSVLPAPSSSSSMAAAASSKPPVSTARPIATSLAGPQAGGSTPAWAWIAGGAGLVALGVGAGFFADHLGARDAVAAQCPGDVCPTLTAGDAQALRARWNRDLGLTIGLGAAGLAGIGIAVAGLVRAPRSATASGARPSVQITVRGAGLAVQGAF